MSAYICLKAARSGYFDCVKYLHENVMPYTSENYCDLVWGNNVACVKFLYEKGYPWPRPPTRPTAAQKKEQTSQAYDLTAIAAMNGNLEMLQYLHEHGCLWDSRTTYMASMNRHRDCSEYALRNGCPDQDQPTADGKSYISLYLEEKNEID